MKKIQNTTCICDGAWLIAISSEEGCFITWTQAKHLFLEINYEQIGLFIADTYCCVMIYS
jgi:hypothetical protein